MIVFTARSVAATNTPQVCAVGGYTHELGYGEKGRDIIPEVYPLPNEPIKQQKEHLHILISTCSYGFVG
jgi:hypothetical protein